MDFILTLLSLSLLIALGVYLHRTGIVYLRSIINRLTSKSRCHSSELMFDLRRNEYVRCTLSDKVLRDNDDPFDLFHSWLVDALNHEGLIEPTAMCLSTASRPCQSQNSYIIPSSRMVLLKDVEYPVAGRNERGGLVWFTNYDSVKGRDLSSNPYAALNFWWPPLERQVNISGPVSKLSSQESDAYFFLRSRGTLN